MLQKVVLTSESVAEILKCDHSNERYWAVIFCGTVYYAFEDGPNICDSGWNHERNFPMIALRKYFTISSITFGAKHSQQLKAKNCLSPTWSLSDSVSLILLCSSDSFSSYCVFSDCSFFWLISSSSISFSLMDISVDRFAKSPDRSWALSVDNKLYWLERWDLRQMVKIPKSLPPKINPSLTLSPTCCSCFTTNQNSHLHRMETWKQWPGFVQTIYQCSETSSKCLRPRMTRVKLHYIGPTFSSSGVVSCKDRSKSIMVCSPCENSLEVFLSVFWEHSVSVSFKRSARWLVCERKHSIITLPWCWQNASKTPVT